MSCALRPTPEQQARPLRTGDVECNACGALPGDDCVGSTTFDPFCPARLGLYQERHGPHKPDQMGMTVGQRNAHEARETSKRRRASAQAGAQGSPEAGDGPPATVRDLNGAASAFVEALGPAPKRRSRSSKKGLELALADLARVFPGGAPADGFAPRHLVALYAKLHESVYGARPEELVDGKSFFAAASAAEKLVRVDFGGDMSAALDFLRWTWRREQRREQVRREQGGGSRIGWRFQFAARSLLTDYRVDLGRQSPRRLSSHR